MKAWNVTLLLIPLLAAVTAAAGARDADDPADLSRRLDSLEVKVERIIIEQMDASPFATGETLSWGKGWYFGATVSSPNQSLVELGHVFGFRGWRPPWEPEYLDRRRGYRVGLSAGFQSFQDAGLLRDDAGDRYYVDGIAPFLKLSWGTPVLLNFISTSTFLRPSLIFPFYEDGDSRDDHPLAGLALGADLEFWIARNKCITLGYMMEGQLNRWFRNREWDEDTVMPLEYRPRAGVRVFF